MQHALLPVILSGGVGSRLWPLSTKMHPKQFCKLTSEHSLFQETALRAKPIQNALPSLIICNAEHRFLIAEQLQELALKTSGIILEPMGKNTAPALAIAALFALEKHPTRDPVLLVLPADHYIKDKAAFHRVALLAYEYALQNYLVTFGITPTQPKTGYGYIQAGENIATPCRDSSPRKGDDTSKNNIRAALGHCGGEGSIAARSFSEHDGVSSNTPPMRSRYSREGEAFLVKQFVEKPDLATAKSYLAEKKYYWNSGIFCFKASVLLKELKKFAPDILESCQNAMQEKTQDEDFCRLPKQIFSGCRSESIDYAIMEKTDRALMIPFQCEWSDVGSFQALWEISEKDEEGNVIKKGLAHLHHTKNCYIHADHLPLVAIGVENLVLIATDKAILVADKHNEAALKTAVHKLNSM